MSKSPGPSPASHPTPRKEPRKEHRVVITGAGVIGAGVVGREAFWSALGVQPRVAALPDYLRVDEFDPLPYMTPKEARRLSRFAQFGIVAAIEAFESAGSPSTDPERSAMMISSGLGGLDLLEAEYSSYEQRGEIGVNPLAVSMLLPSAATSNMATRLGWVGPSFAVSGACATGTLVLGDALRLIRHGYCDIALVGAADAEMSVVVAQSMKRLRVGSRGGATRPFDVNRDGFVGGEGAGVLVVESEEHALSRNAQVLAYLEGQSMSSDAFSMATPEPGGAGVKRALSQALADAGVSASEVNQINVHGTGTKLNDEAEAEAISELFAHKPVVTAIKGATGHCGGAAGAIEAVAVVESFLRREVPPIVGLEEVDPAFDLNLSRGYTPYTPGVSVSLNLGLGGFTAAIVLRPPETEAAS